MWIEDELQKDVDQIQETIVNITRDYKAQLPRTIRSRMTENREKTTDFLKHFYHRIRNAEFYLYRNVITKIGA